MLTDFRYALRSLASKPLVTTVAVVSLALGIGVNTAIFSVFERMLLRRLPVAEPDRIVNVISPGPKPGSRSTGDGGRVEAVFSYPLFRDLERLQNVGLQVAGYRDFQANLSFKGQTSEVEGIRISGQYFQILGLTPALGRLLGPEDDRIAGGHPVVVLSHSYWSTRFGADPAILDATVVVNGEPMTIVGVAPEGFAGTITMDRPQIFMPLSMAQQPLRESGRAGTVARNNHWLYVSARLESGVSRAQAEQLINVPFTSLIRHVEYPELRPGMGDRDREAFQQRRIILQDGSRGRNSSGQETQTFLLLMFAITGFVLAIACANVANLLLARVTDRATEIAVRLSVGATARRLVRLLLVEACIVGIMGGASGLLIARLTLNGLLAMMPADDVPMLVYEINTTVILFALGLGLVTSVVFGVFPALHAVRAARGSGLHAQPNRVSGSRAANRFRTSLATTQIALATALLGMSGLFIVSLVNLAREELGIRREGLITFRLSPHQNGYTPEQALAFFERVEEDLRAAPGVVAATSSTVPILSNNDWRNNLTVEGFPADPDADMSVSVTRVSWDYFHTLGIAMLAGREFNRTDTISAPKVAIVNEAFTRKFNLGPNVIGTRLAMGAGGNRPLDIEIVGLVRDSKYSEVRAPAPPQLALPYRQAEVGPLTFYARTESDPRALMGAIPALVARLDDDLPITNLLTMQDQIWENTARERVLSTLSSSFAVLATVLAAIGLYAVLAYGVTQRLREFGIRIALGAQRGHVRWLVLAQVTRITLVGGVIGALLAIALGRLSQSLLIGVAEYSAVVIVGAAVLVLCVAMAAGALPARRATTVNPIEALRIE